MSRLVALSSGSAAEGHTFDEPRYRARLAAVVDTLDARAGWPDTVDGVWVPEGTPRRRLTALAPRLDQVLAGGGAVVLFGDHQAGWPLGARWTYRPAGGAGETTAVSTAHGFAARVGDAAVALHHHGVLEPPEGAEVLLVTTDGAAVAYLDRRSTSGTLLVTTLDPLAHFGATGAPVAATFLDAFLPWVCDRLLGDGARR